MTIFKVKKLLKTYMLTIYKLTGDFKFDELIDIGQVDEEGFKLFDECRKEILADIEARKPAENIIDVGHVSGSLDKAILQKDMLNNGFDYQLRHEGLI